jgi:hypothetical protein
MNKFVTYLLIFFSSFILGGCNFIDEYYVFDKNYLTDIEKKLGSMKDGDLKKELIAMFNSTQIRIKLNSSKSQLVVIQSIDQTNLSEDLKIKLVNMRWDIFQSESKTYDSCRYINENNWICKTREFSSGYEMKNGDLFRDGEKLDKQYSINFK